MLLNHWAGIVTRVVVAALWLLGAVIVTTIVTVPLLYLLPVLALISFFLTDYFSVFVLALLLTILARTFYIDQVSDTTRTLIIDSIWIAAFVSVGLKRLKPFRTTVAEKQSGSSQTPDRLLTVNGNKGTLSDSFRHDLQTPLRLILGYCQATFLMERNQRLTIPPVVSDNVQAIYRNAQQLERLLTSLINQFTPAQTLETEEIDPALIIQESAAFVQELLTTYNTKLAIKLDNPLPKLKLHRLTVRQLLLTVLRGIIRANGQSATEALVTITASAQNPDLHIAFSSVDASIQHAVTDPSWSQTQHLAEMIGGRLWLQESPDSDASLYSQIILEIPLPQNISVTVAEPLIAPILHDNRIILVVAEESEISDFFKEKLSQFNVIGITDIRAATGAMAQMKPAAIILTDRQYQSQLKKLSDQIDQDIPIILYPITTTQQLLRQLDVAYLPKPVDYSALWTILTNASAPVTHILVVDDNMDSAQMLALMLSAISPAYVSHKAYLAKDAIALLDEQPVDAIVVDVTLPDMDGITLVQQIRSRERFVQVPVILVSAQDNLKGLPPVSITNEVTLFRRGGIELSRLAAFIQEY